MDQIQAIKIIEDNFPQGAFIFYRTKEGLFSVRSTDCMDKDLLGAFAAAEKFMNDNKDHAHIIDIDPSKT